MVFGFRSKSVKNAKKTGIMNLHGKVPSNINKARGVKEIIFRFTEMKEFPPAKILKHKNTLERLSLRSLDPIVYNSSTMNELKKLKRLMVWSPGLELKPLPNLPELEYLDIRATPIFTARPDLSNFSVYKKLKHLSIVSIPNMYYFPPSLTTLSHLEHLNLHKNDITKIPPEIKNMTSLKYLYLSENSYVPKAFPTSVCELHNLEVLHMFLIHNIPSDIIKMKKLRELTVEIEEGKPIKIHSNILKMSGLEIYVKETTSRRGNFKNIIAPMSVDKFYERYAKKEEKEKVYKFKMNKNTSFIGSNILNSSMKNIPPNKRYFIVPPNTPSNSFLVKKVVNKNALNKCEGKCPFTRVRFTNNNMKHLNKNVILNYFKNRLKNSKNVNRDIENFKKNKPRNITNKEINDIVNKLKNNNKQ